MKPSYYIKIAVCIACLAFTGQMTAQDDCATSESKKALKLLDKAQGSPNMSLDERRGLLYDALDADENCLSCRFGLARLQYQIASDKNTSYGPALDNFNKVAEQCKTYHADVYYYSGIIAYGNQDYPAALESFTAFIEFNADKGKISRDNDKKLADIESILPEVVFYSNFYENPLPYNPVRQDGVSTKGDEYLPMLSPDNSYIFFTRKETIKNKGDIVGREVESFMRGSWNKQTKIYEKAEPLAPPFNVGDNYGGVSISLDNREMFITVCKPMGTSGRKNCDLYSSTYVKFTDENGKEGMRWTGLKNLGDKVNTRDGWEAQPTLSADGNTLYFASARENSTKDKEGNPSIDIYYSERKADGAWSEAQAIGKTINTGGNDKSPFLHVDSKTMYFSSDGHIGAGGYDIFYSKQGDDGKWTSPKNLGYPINSQQDEHGLIVSTDGAKAFFASSNVQSSRDLDIYAFEVPQAARPEKVLLLKGDITNADGEIIEGARIELKYTETKEVKEIEINKEDGTYAAVVNLRPDEEVMMTIKSDSEDLAFNTRMFTMADTAEVVQDLSVKVDKIEEGKTYKIHDIRFPTGSSDIDESSKQVLIAFAEYLSEYPTIVIEIGGHTDDVGDEQKNMALSTDRAFEVFGFLQDAGVKATRMSFKGYGQTKPVVSNSSDASRALNRRTEFKITRK